MLTSKIHMVHVIGILCTQVQTVKVLEILEKKQFNLN